MLDRLNAMQSLERRLTRLLSWKSRRTRTRTKNAAVEDELEKRINVWDFNLPIRQTPEQNAPLFLYFLLFPAGFA